MTSRWQPYGEPVGVTLLRTGTIALVLGALLVRWWGGGVARWPLATLMALWPSLGGHWVELWFLNSLRPRIPDARMVQIAARICVWFVGGSGLFLGMELTALTGFRPERWPAWWLGGIAFIAVELVAHLALQLRDRPNFYDGRG